MKNQEALELNKRWWDTLTPIQRRTHAKERHRRVRVRKAAKAARKLNRLRSA